MRYFLATTALVLGLGAVPAHAQKKPQPALGHDALKHCIDLEDETEGLRKEYNAQVHAGNELVKQQQQIHAELDTMKATLDSGDTSGMDAYNAKVEEFNAIGEKHEEYALRMAEISEKQRIIAEEFNKSCAGKSFLNADLLEIKHRKK
jgi:hypothetical protein